MREWGMTYSAYSAEIQAAIDNLTALKVKGTQGPWRLDGPDNHYYGEGHGDYLGTSLVSGRDRSPVARGMVPVTPNEEAYRAWAPTAESDLSLIVTLHRTIDSQLAVLGSALSRMASTVGMHGHDVAALGLARSINGTQ